MIKEFGSSVDAQNEMVENQREEIELRNQAFKDMQDECNKWAKKATRLVNRVTDVPTRDTCIESENLKLKEEISMLKTENLKLTNDLKIVCISDDEKKRIWEQEAITTKIVFKAEHYAKRWV